MPRGGDTSAIALANGKKVGRPRKEKIAIVAGKGIASQVLAQVDEVKLHLEFLHADKALSELSDVERKERERELDRLTNRRDGLPAQGIFSGDTRETAPPVERGNLPNHFERPVHPSGPHKPN